ncbi:hypothetical protein FC093_20020 [Ilyomonas limi]|uniref:VanZ-like domain-containing protein n=1 Tax=Ilyomonas limi TaxID=2575867 RepID=A0A4U3KUF5_9BACT|nr:hypothetical protein [Ilyomonas limi]TKK65399.1 hypothetical protein FC093_20020 [Ilyomonas limi]
MRLLLYQDITLNIALPIIAGSFIYLTFEPFGSHKIINNYLPDGLWAYALMSTILIIWSRVINFVWVVASLILFIVFETLQYYHIAQGTGDCWDILTYSVFGFIALLTNKYFTAIK